jgi:hypothetical protein
MFDFIHFWSVTLVNTIKTTSFTPPSVIKLYLYVCIRLYMFDVFIYHVMVASFTMVICLLKMVC